MRRAAAFATAVLAVASVGGCLTVLGIDEDYSRRGPDGGVAGVGVGAGGGTGGTGAAAGGGTASSSGSSAGGMAGAGGGIGGSGGSPPPMCPVGMGSAMVDVGGYCVDVTEVTRAHYDAFLLAGVQTQAVTGMPMYCGFNVTYVPSAGWPPAPNQADLPVNYVDWCDALAYCTWAGKRLCGAIGGGPLDQAQSGDAAASEWFRACSNDGATEYTYGSMFGDECNTGSGGPEPVGSNPDCHGTIARYDQIFDLTGNVREWEDSCSGAMGAMDTCNRRGGSFPSTEATAMCTNLMGGGLVTRANANDATGIRCCADLRAP